MILTNMSYQLLPEKSMLEFYKRDVFLKKNWAECRCTIHTVLDTASKHKVSSSSALIKSFDIYIYIYIYVYSYIYISHCNEYKFYLSSNYDL